MNYIKQYNKIGMKYLHGQKDFYKKNKDEAITAILDFMGDLKNKTILDMGCGGGKDILLYENLRAKKIYGIDNSDIMVKEAKKIVQNPQNIYKRSIVKTKFKNNFFDVIVSRFSLHYLKDFKLAYTEISRILKKDGMLIFAVAHPIRDFMVKKNKNYYQKEKVRIEVYDNKTSIYFLSHTFIDYFSKEFFNNFYVTDFYEQRKMKKRKNNIEIPSFFVFKAIKK